MNKSGETLLIIYDENCSLCRTLAGFIPKYAGGNLAICTQRIFFADHPDLDVDGDQLMLWDGRELRVGAEAWRVVMGFYPGLAGLSWLARKLGVESQAAMIVQRSGERLRRICFRCGQRKRKRG